MIIRKLHKNAIPIFVMSALAFMTAGCSMIYDQDEPDCPKEEKEQVYIQFRIVNNTISAHKEATRVDYTYEEASGAENYIGLGDKDFRLYIFDGNSNTSKLIAEYKPTLTPQGNNYASYDIKVGMDKDGLSVTGDEVTLHLVCFANWEATGGAATAWPTVTKGVTTLLDLINLNGSTFSLAASGDGVTWSPNLLDNSEGGRRIPMYGFRTYTLNKQMLDRSTFQYPYNLTVNVNISGDDGCLYMLRSMARMDVIDNIVRETGTDYPRITSVSLTNWNTQGYCINNNLEGVDTRSQVSGVSIPTSVSKTTVPMNFYHAYTELPAAYAERGCFRAYFPEMVLNTARPVLHVTVEPYEGKTETYTVDLNEKNFSDWLGSIRRNYIYRLLLNYSLESELTLQYTVCPWENYTVDIPSFE